MRDFAVKLLAVSLFCLLYGESSNAATINSTVHGTTVDFGTNFTTPQDGVAEFRFVNFVEMQNQTNIPPPGFCCSNTINGRGIVEFDISSISGPVSAASLGVSANALTSFFAATTVTVNVFGFTGDGSLNLSDHSTSGSTFLGTFGFSQGQASASFDVTSFINDQILLDDPLHFAGLQLLLGAQAGARLVLGNTGLNSPDTPFPTLTFELAPEVTPVPLPAAFPLLGGALSLLGFFGWRRKRMAAV